MNEISMNFSNTTVVNYYLYYSSFFVFSPFCYCFVYHYQSSTSIIIIIINSGLFDVIFIHQFQSINNQFVKHEDHKFLHDDSIKCLYQKSIDLTNYPGTDFFVMDYYYFDYYYFLNK